MLGNLFEERNWVLPKDYLVTEDKKEDAIIAKPPLKEESKMGEQTSSQKEEKCGWGPKESPKEKWGRATTEAHTQATNQKARYFEHD